MIRLLLRTPFFATRLMAPPLASVRTWWLLCIYSLSPSAWSRLARSAAAFHVDSNLPCYFCLLTSGTGGNYINAAVAAGDVMRLWNSANYSPLALQTPNICVNAAGQSAEITACAPTTAQEAFFSQLPWSISLKINLTSFQNNNHWCFFFPFVCFFCHYLSWTIMFTHAEVLQSNLSVCVVVSKCYILIYMTWKWFPTKLCETMWLNRPLRENQLDNRGHKHIEPHQCFSKLFKINEYQPKPM